jgi:hypothetical protein
VIRRLRRFVIALVVLAVLLTIADRVALRLAQDQVTKQVLKHATWTGGHTSVHIGGFPFLTQVALGNYRDVEVRAEGVTIDGLSGVTADVHLRGVHLSLSDLRSDATPPITIDRVSGSAQAPYSAIAARILAVGRDGGLSSLALQRSDGQLRIKAGFDVLGVSANATAVASIAVVNGAITLSASAIDLGDDSIPAAVVGAATSALNGALSQAAVLAGLPYGLAPTSVTIGASGIEAAVAGRDVTV